MKTVKFEFKNAKDENVTIFIKKPSAKDFKEAKIYSNKISVELIKSKTSSGEPAFIMRSQVKDYILKSGIWSKKDDEYIEELTKEVDRVEAKLLAGGISKSEGRKLALELVDLRDRQLTEIIKLNEFDKLTVEYHAENAEHDYLFSSCLLDEEGNRIFTDVDDCVEKFNDEPYYKEALQELKSIIYGQTKKIDDILMERVEYKYLSHFKYIDTEFRLIDPKTGEFVDKNGKAISDTIVEDKIELDFDKFTEDAV